MANAKPVKGLVSRVVPRHHVCHLGQTLGLERLVQNTAFSIRAATSMLTRVAVTLRFTLKSSLAQGAYAAPAMRIHRRQHTQAAE